MFRLFVSSTFGDLKPERDALHRYVFPRLERLCTARGVAFSAVDLRWGVDEEASLDQRTLPICLAEVERCTPWFLLLLGERYGWRPLPFELAAAEFDRICTQLAAEDGRELTDWYELDENADPPVRRLRPRAGQWVDGDAWCRQEARLRGLLRASASLPDLGRSATEHEILRGALPQASGTVHCFMRTIEGLPHNARAAAPFRDLDCDQQPDLEAARRIAELRARVWREIPHAAVHEVTAAWSDGSVSEDHLVDLCERVHAVVSDSLGRELGRLAAVEPLSAEVAAHERFARERTAYFEGRDDARAAIRRYVEGAQPLALVLHGAAGVGKSTVMARAALDAADAPDGAIVVARFVGATASSANPRLLLESIASELARSCDEAEESVPLPSLAEVCSDLRDRLARAARRSRVIILLDAVDQLSGDVETALSWLEGTLPLGVRVIVSTTPSTRLQRLSDLPTTEIGPLAPAAGEALLDAWLTGARRRLTEAQRANVLEAFGEHCLPLHMRLCFEEARHWTSTTVPSPLPATTEAIADALVARLCEEHGPVILQRALGAIAASRHGLCEEELRSLLSGDIDVLVELRQRSPQSPAADSVPPVALSRLLYDLRPYLSERRVDGTTAIGFFHRQLAAVVATRYLSDARPFHARLATYFARSPGPRRLAELPYHLTLAREWTELLALLTDGVFQEAKAEQHGTAPGSAPTAGAAYPDAGVRGARRCGHRR